jgi:hypothetical protein
MALGRRGLGHFERASRNHSAGGFTVAAGDKK